MTTKIGVIAVTYGHMPFVLPSFVYQFLSQSSQNYKLIVLHDGPSEDGSAKFMDGICKEYPHIQYIESVEREHYPDKGEGWGHYNRARGLALMDTEWVWFQNCDNQVVPKAIQILEQIIQDDTLDCILWPTPHNYFGYKPFLEGFANCHTDMAQFMIKTTLAQETGFNHRNFYADGLFIEDLKIKKPDMRLAKLDCLLSTHN